MAKLTLRDIGNKLKEKLQTGVSNVGNFAKQSAQYLPPVQAYNAVKTMATPQFRQQAQSVADWGSNLSQQGASFGQQIGQRIQQTPQFKMGPIQDFKTSLIKKAAPTALGMVGSAPGEFVRGFGQSVRELSEPSRFLKAPLYTKGQVLGTPQSPTKAGIAFDVATSLPDVTDLGKFALMGGLATSVLKPRLDAKALKPFLPEIRNVSKMLGNMDEIPSLTPQQVKAAESVVAKIRGNNAVAQINKLNKNPKDFYNSLRTLLAGAEDQILNPNINIGFTAKALDTSKFRQPTKGVESMPSVMKTPELPKVDPFEADMIKYNNELSNAAKLPKTKKPFIDTSRQSTEVGDIKSNISENGGVVDSIKRSFADWVNTRKASQVEGILQGRSFADLKEKGMQGIFEFQSGDKTGRYADVKNYFDTKYGQMQEKGIDFNYKEEYLTQIWDNTSEEISRVFGRSLSKTPSFTLESLIKNYQEGINAGLKPKYNNIPDLIQSYESATNKAIADHDFFRTLIKENMITTGSKAPRDWVTIDPDRFPRFSVKTDDGTYRGIYKAPPELAKMLNNYLGGAKFEWLAKAADWTSSVKNRVLSFGIPGTAINAHGFNILARNVMASKNPIEGAITGIKYMLNPISAQRQLDATLAKAPEAVKYGLTLSANEFTNILQEPQGFRSKFGDVWNKLFERGLFDRMLPALKLQKFTEVFEGYKKGGMNEYEAGKAAAKFTNDVFGGINIDELGKSRDFENMLRVTILAPDWLKTNLNLAGKIPQSFTTKILDPKMSAYRKFATTMLGSYITANIVNKLTSGHWMYQNDPGNSFNIEAGYTEDGQKRYIRPFGTAADFVRLPSDVFTALKKGDVSVIGRLVRNRLSIPLGVGIGMMTDTDYAGQPIGWRGTDKYGNEMPLKQRIAGVGGEVLTLAGMPSFMKQGIDYASGKTGGEQALLQAFELPVRYSGGAFNKSSQFIKGLGQREGAKGKELYDLIKSVKGVTLSKNQKELLTQNGLKSLPDIMQQKKINSMNTQVQKIKEDIVSGSLTQEEGAVKIQDIVNQIPEVSTNKKGADNSLVSTASASDELNKPYVFQYTSPSGKISIESVDLSKDIPEPKLTGNKELDKKLISTYKGELTSRATDIRKLYEAGKIDANQAEKLLGELKIKSGSVGGVKKPKKITLKVSNYKAPKITIKKRSSAKIPTIKFKKPKKTKIVRRYTIK